MVFFKFCRDNLPAIVAGAAIAAVYFLSRIVETTLAVGVVGAIATVLVLFVALLKKPENALFLMAFLLPFERIPSVDIAGMSLKINYVIALVAFIVLLTTGIFSGRRIKSDPILAIILVLLADFALSIAYALNITRSLQVFSFMCLMAIAYFTVKALINKKEHIAMILRGLFYGAAVVAVLGIYQFVGDMIGLPNSLTLLKKGYDSVTFGFARVQGASAEPLYFANYIFIPLIIAVTLLVRGRLQEIIPRWFGIFLIVLLGINFILAISRGAFLAAALTLVVFTAVNYKKILTLKIIIPAVTIIGIIIVGTYLALLRSEPRALDEFVGHLFINDREVGESVVVRLNAIDQAKELFWERPLLGVGIGNFGPNVHTDFDPEGKPKGGWSIVNNEYLEILAENGVVGFGIIVLLFIALFYYGIKAIRTSGGGLVAASLEGSLFALLAILFQYLTFSTLYIFHLWFLMAFVAEQSAYLLGGHNEA